MVHFERSLRIQQRLDAILDLIEAGQHSTPQIADELDISTATVSRCIETLRDQGHAIKAVRDRGQWCYRLDASDEQSLGRRERSSELSKTGKS